MTRKKPQPKSEILQAFPHQFRRPSKPRMPPSVHISLPGSHKTGMPDWMAKPGTGGKVT